MHEWRWNSVVGITSHATLVTVGVGEVAQEANDDERVSASLTNQPTTSRARCCETLKRAIVPLLNSK